MPERSAAAEGRPREGFAPSSAGRDGRETQAMSRRVPLDRLRDVSKQRSIRRPGWSQAPGERIEDDGEVAVRVEWPISR
jgi:hypothetical protein